MPNISSIHIDQALTNIAIGYPVNGLIGPRLLSDVPVEKKTDKYFIFDSDREGIAQIDDRREPGAEAVEVDLSVSTDSYDTGGHSLKSVVPQEEYENADSPLRPLADKTEFLAGRLLINQEISLKAALDAALTGGLTSDPTNEWNDYTSGDPVADMNTAIDSVEDNTGFRPNIIAMDSKVWRAVKHHPDIVDRVKYMGTDNSPGDVTVEGFAALFDLEEIIVSWQSQNTALKGQSASLSRIWGDDVYVAYRPPRPGLKIPAFGYRYVWRPFTGGLNGWMVRRWTSEERMADVVQADKYYDQKITLAAAGYRLQNRLS